MRQNPNAKRSRGRGGRKGGNPRSQVYDSNGPSARVRGNAMQVYEKYQQLARDASSSGDRVAMENLLQHAEHYYRLMVASGQRLNENRDGDGGRDGDGREGNDRRFDGEQNETRENGHDTQQNRVEAQNSGDESGSDDNDVVDPRESAGAEEPERRPRRGRRVGANGVNGNNGNGVSSQEGAESGDGAPPVRPPRPRRVRKVESSEPAAGAEADDTSSVEPTQA